MSTVKSAGSRVTFSAPWGSALFPADGAATSWPPQPVRVTAPTAAAATKFRLIGIALPLPSTDVPIDRYRRRCRRPDSFSRPSGRAMIMVGTDGRREATTVKLLLVDDDATLASALRRGL